MNIIICDDADMYLDRLRDTVMNWAARRNLRDAVLVRCFSSAEDLLETWQTGMSADVLFLDIQIPGEMSGMELAKIIREMDDHAIIVFVTNYAEYACEGYRVNALRYIQKPVSEEMIFECLDIAYHQWEFAQTQSIVIDTRKQTLVLPHRDILFIEAAAHYLCINRISQPPVQVRSRISDMCKILPEEIFIRCHRGFVVNLSHVRSVTKTSIVLVGDRVIPIGEKYRESAFEKFRKYHQGVLL